MKILLCLVIMVTLSGCGGYMNVKNGNQALFQYTQENIKNKIIIGTTTKQDILNMLGEPDQTFDGSLGAVFNNSSVVCEDNSKIKNPLERMPQSLGIEEKWMYIGNKTESGALGWIVPPLGIKTNHKSLTVYFKNDKVTKYNFTSE